MNIKKSIPLQNRIFLSPMLEPNDIAFRILCKRAGAKRTYTGMVNALSKQPIHLDDTPILQLFGNTPKGIASFVKTYDSQVSGWDFNLGCPSKLSKKLSHGAFMHEDFKNILSIIKAIKKSTKKPVSIKLRKSPQAIQIAMVTQPYLDAVGIHGRTSQQGYSGNSDYDFALSLKKALNIPVIYSGDVTLSNYKKILQDFEFVFIGRSAMGNPEIFAKIANNKKTSEELGITFNEYLLIAKKYNIYFRQIKFQAMQFTKGANNAKELRIKLIRAKTIQDIEMIMKECS